MRKNEVAECIQGLFFNVCKELLESMDCNIAQVDYELDGFADCPVACIDAGSPDIEFKVALQLPTSVLAMTYPVGDTITTIEEDRLEDWISELANQLLGRLKNRLIEHDCFVTIGLPSSYYGADVAQLLSENSQQASYFFDVDGEVCGCSISLEVFDEALSFSVEVNEDMKVQSEGEMEMF
jgi:hypothetical protein